MAYRLMFKNSVIFRTICIDTTALLLLTVSMSFANEVTAVPDGSASVAAAGTRPSPFLGSWHQLLRSTPSERIAPAEVADEAKVTVTCTCQTKGNPSECNVGRDFIDHEWPVSAYENERLTDPQFVAEFCKHHRDDACFCDDIKYFRGSIKH